MKQKACNEKIFYSGINGLRALSFLIVFFFHSNIEGFQIGWGGVTAFFVISGFLITEILVNSKNAKKYFVSFYMRRILRILPIYIIVILGSTIAIIYARKIFPNDLFFQLTYLQNIYWVYTNYSSDLVPFLAHTWTLAIEEQFYLIWPLLIFVIPNTKLFKLCLAVILLGIIFRTISVVYFNNDYATSILLFSQIDTLALGALLAIHKTQKTRYNGLNFLFSNAWWLGLLGIGIIIAYLSFSNGIGLYDAYTLFKSPAGYLHNVVTAQVYFFIALFSSGIIYRCINSPNLMLNKLLSNRIMLHYGKISYGLYLYLNFRSRKLGNKP